MRIDALDDQALDSVMEVFHSQVEFREDPKFPEASVYRGRDALRAYAKRFSGELDAFSWEAEDVLDAGDDRVVVSSACAVGARAAARISIPQRPGSSR